MSTIFQNFASVTIGLIALFLISHVSSHSEMTYLQPDGPQVQKDWLIKPGKPCNEDDEKRAISQFLTLVNLSKYQEVENLEDQAKDILKDNVCYGGREVTIRPIRCVESEPGSVDGKCDCHHPQYTWDYPAKTCRTRVGGPCHTSGDLWCITNATCRNLACVCEDKKICVTGKQGAGVGGRLGNWILAILGLGVVVCVTRF